MAEMKSIAEARSLMEDAVLELRLLVQSFDDFACERHGGPPSWVFPLARRMEAAHESIEDFVQAVAERGQGSACPSLVVVEAFPAPADGQGLEAS